jgi:uncharacterized protein YdhG (YjbR/CyaY superfamily)
MSATGATPSFMRRLRIFAFHPKVEVRVRALDDGSWPFADVCPSDIGVVNLEAMAETDFKSVDEYIASQPKAVLERVRNIIRKTVPVADEVISYKIPTYKLHGSAVIYFAGWKKHYSLYPATDHVVAALKDDLVPYEVRKGTIRFPLSQPVPAKLIERITRLRAKEVAEVEKVKAVAPKKR